MTPNFWKKKSLLHILKITYPKEEFPLIPTQDNCECGRYNPRMGPHPKGWCWYTWWWAGGRWFFFHRHIFLCRWNFIWTLVIPMIFLQNTNQSLQSFNLGPHRCLSKECMDKRVIDPHMKKGHNIHSFPGLWYFLWGQIQWLENCCFLYQTNYIEFIHIRLLIIEQRNFKNVFAVYCTNNLGAPPKPYVICVTFMMETVVEQESLLEKKRKQERNKNLGGHCRRSLNFL